MTWGWPLLFLFSDYCVNGVNIWLQARHPFVIRVVFGEWRMFTSDVLHLAD